MPLSDTNRVWVIQACRGFREDVYVLGVYRTEADAEAAAAGFRKSWPAGWTKVESYYLI